MSATNHAIAKMGVGTVKYVGFTEYVKEILKTAEYKRDPGLECVVAVVSVLPGCMTQGDNFEEARDPLIDAIELWVTVGLKEGEKMPSINGHELVTAIEHPEADSPPGTSVHTRGGTLFARRTGPTPPKTRLRRALQWGQAQLHERGRHRQTIPNPHGKNISSHFIKEILKQAGISAEEWLSA